MSDNLKKTMVNALKWSAVDRTLQQGVQFVIGIVLARLLCPADYGLIGMIMIFAQIAYVMVESGLGSALLRTNDITETHYNTMFYTNLTLSVVMYVALFFLAPFIADFFHQPSLVEISRVTFIAILFNALYLVPYNHINREMDYKSLAKVNFISTVISGGIGIAMAFTGFGVWALVVQQTGYHFFRMIAFYFLTRWRPSALFSWSILKGYIPFSANMLGTTLLTVLFNNIYTFIIGRTYKVDVVGNYTQGYKISETVNFTFVAILGSAYNLFSKIHDQKERLRQYVRSLNQKISIICLPLTLFLTVSAQPLFFILFGEKWLDAVPFFQLLCLANLFVPIYQINVHAINARGYSKTTFMIELFKRAIMLISILCSFYFDLGIYYMLLGYVLACWMAFAISCITTKRHIGVYFKHQFKDMITSVLTAIIIALPCYAASLLIENLYLLFAVEVTIAAMLYILIITTFQKDLLKEVKLLLKGEQQ